MWLPKSVKRFLGIKSPSFINDAKIREQFWNEFERGYNIGKNAVDKRNAVDVQLKYNKKGNHMKKISIRYIPPKHEFLTRVEVMTATCKVCGTKFNPRGHVDAERLKAVGIDATCDAWVTHWQDRNNENVVRVGGVHYMYGNHLQDARITQDDTLTSIAQRFAAKTVKKQGLGMSGAVVIIRFNDGRVVITNDLWHQGDIPEVFKQALPDNAELEWVS